MIYAAAGLIVDDRPAQYVRPLHARVSEQWVHAVAFSSGPLPVVAPGQTWAHRCPQLRPVQVLAVDRASVWTDQGRTTVFRLLRDRRLVEPAPSRPA